MITAILNISIQLVCLIVAWRYLFHESERHWVLFKWYLIVVVFTETVGFYLGLTTEKSNQWWYNLYLPVEGTFISYFIFRLLRPYGARPILWYSWMGLFLTTYMWEHYTVGLGGHSYYSILLFNVSFIAAFVYYVALLFRAPPEPTPLYRHAPAVWMGSTAFFYCGTFIVGLTADLLLDNELKVGDYTLYAIIMVIIILINYGLWIHSIMCRYAKTN